MSDHDCESPETCGVCHNCQKPGHTAGACPEKKPQCIGCDLTEKLARRFGWSEEVNCTPWGWLEDQIRDRDRILSDSPDYKTAHEIIQRLTETNHRLILDAADRQVALEKAERRLRDAAGAMARYPRDWAADYRDAWLYGIIIGWDEPALSELAVKHRWSEKTLDKLRECCDGEGKP